jgi:peptidoglycan-N-acetylglucosamine deacetylase
LQIAPIAAQLLCYLFILVFRFQTPQFSMRHYFSGFALVGLLVFAACHNIFSKDRSGRRAATAISRQTNIKTNAAEPANVDVAAAQPVDTALKYVYLTFDDGPDAGTMNCYQVCKSRGVKATFFLVGEHAYNHRGRKILDTMRADLRHFLFANHSYTHADHNRYESFYGDPGKAFRDFMRVQDSLEFPAPVARFPGNNVWVVDSLSRSTRLTRELSKMMDSAGYDVLGWDVEWHFDRQSRPVQSAEAMAKEVMVAVESKSSVMKNHVVFLAHDRMFREPAYRDSLVRMISILQSQKGYIFETADRYPRLRKNGRALLAKRA